MNSTQKNFRKKMKKGLKELKKQNKQAYYKYITQNNLDNPEQRLKSETKEKIKNILKKIILIPTIIIIAVIITPFIYNKTLNLNNKTNIEKIENTNGISNNITIPKENEQKEIIDFINTIKPYIDNISNDTKKKNNEVEQINNKKITKNDYVNNIQTHNELVKKNLANISNTTVPKELNNYVTILKEGYQLLSSAYENESIYLKTNQQKYKQSAEDNYKISNENLKNADTELIRILDSKNINHK